VKTKKENFGRKPKKHFPSLDPCANSFGDLIIFTTQRKHGRIVKFPCPLLIGTVLDLNCFDFF
jgi:hypothetical protein